MRDRRQNSVVRVPLYNMGAPGFTLLEVMIALAVGGIALGSIYAIGAASTRHFRQQQRISATQTSLRMAMDQLKRDFQRAGFLSTPNVQMGPEACSLPGAPIDDATGALGTGRLAAISNYLQAVPEPDSLDPDSLNNWDSVDQVLLTGNYTTSGEYPGISLQSNQLTVNIPMTSQSFRRDFTYWYGASAGQCDLAAFSNAFPIGRLVRIRNPIGRSFFSRIASVTCVGNSTATVTVVDTIPNICSIDRGFIAPVSVMRYQVVNATGDEVSRVTANRVAVLRRTEVMPDNKANPLMVNNVATDDRAILDYVVQFNVSFLMSQAANTPFTVNFVPALATDVRANPERVRGVIIDLAVRTAEQEPEFPASSPDVPTAFRVFATQGAARVRRLHAELLLPNVAYDGY